MDERKPIVVFGVTGRQGGAVAKALLDDGWPVHGVVRNPSSEQAVALAAAGAEIVQASLDEDASLRAALKASYGVFCVLPGDLTAQGEVDRGVRIASLAAEEGVKHFVYSSGASAGSALTGIARFDAKPQIEDRVRDLQIPWTIIRPMIFMDMLVRPSPGLAEGKLVSLVRPDQAMQIVATDDIGRIVAAIFADKSRFNGVTLKIASDTLTGDELASAMANAAGRPVTYSQIPDEVFAANPDLAHMAASLENGPLSDHADLRALREIASGLTTFREWLDGSGHAQLIEALGRG